MPCDVAAHGGLRSTNVLRVDLPTVTVGGAARTSRWWVTRVIHLTEMAAGEAGRSACTPRELEADFEKSLGKVEK